MRILIVDDSSVMRKMVLRALRQAGFGGHDFEEASDGAEALGKIESDPPDLILADWNMPNMNGITLLHKMNEQQIRVPFCFVTSEATADMRKQADDAGAKAFVTKPFTPDDMSDALGGLID